jgi:glutamate 5-kinase
MLNADYLILLTDVDCLYTDNPRSNSNVKPIRTVDDIEGLMSTTKVSTPGSALGTGGMVTKILAAQLASAAGINMIICSGMTPKHIPLIIDQIELGKHDDKLLYTHFLPKANPMVDRKWWIVHGLAERGSIIIDKGAYMAISDTKSNASLFAAGIVRVEEDFADQQAVALKYEHTDKDTGKTDILTIGKGLVNYTSAEV